MPRIDIVRSCTVTRTPRVVQLEGIFDISPKKEQKVTWKGNLPIEEKEWQLGCIVGPSGCGKSTIAGELFPDAIKHSHRWDKGKSCIDGFPKGLPIAEITKALGQVGFSSPPAWLRPFHVLSTGQQFRVSLAHAFLTGEGLVVVDEFTSVVDRVVAKIGSAAISKMVRSSDKQFVAVTCHYDVLEWLQPDWTYEPYTNTFAWGSVQSRPAIELEITRCTKAAWKIFKHHHYLSGDIKIGSACYLASWQGEPVAFVAVLPFPHASRPGWREHRLVCLPDFQGVGIGNAVSEYVASVYAAMRRPYYSTTSNPAMINHRNRSKLQRLSLAWPMNVNHDGPPPPGRGW